MEKLGYIVMLQYKNALGRIVQKCHPEVFETEQVAREQMGHMVIENKGASFWIVEVPIIPWQPRLTAVQ